MIATLPADRPSACSIIDEARDRLRARTVGNDDWVTLALHSCERYLLPAIASGNAHRIARALRAVTHAPSPEQVDDIVGSVCDSLAARAYTARDTKTIGNIARARTTIRDVLTVYDEQSQRGALETARLRETVEGFVRMAALADKRLADRLEAVGSFGMRIAAAMHLPDSVTLDTEFAGLLHDIGMVNVAKERAPETHSTIGESFVRSTPALEHLAPLVRSHHERFDGSGFPDGLRAGEIPLPARIIGVAASFIDLVTGTAGRKALSPHDACLEVSAHAGSHFDPDVVTAMLHVLHFRPRTNRTLQASL